MANATQHQPDANNNLQRTHKPSFIPPPTASLTSSVPLVVMPVILSDAEESTHESQAVTQQKLMVRRAEKKNREEVEAKAVHDAVKGPRRAKEKAHENKVWLVAQGAKRKSYVDDEEAHAHAKRMAPSCDEEQNSSPEQKTKTKAEAPSKVRRARQPVEEPRAVSVEPALPSPKAPSKSKCASNNSVPKRRRLARDEESTSGSNSDSALSVESRGSWDNNETYSASSSDDEQLAKKRKPGNVKDTPIAIKAVATHKPTRASSEDDTHTAPPSSPSGVSSINHVSSSASVEDIVAPRNATPKMKGSLSLSEKRERKLADEDTVAPKSSITKFKSSEKRERKFADERPMIVSASPARGKLTKSKPTTVEHATHDSEGRRSNRKDKSDAQSSADELGAKRRHKDDGQMQVKRRRDKDDDDLKEAATVITTTPEHIILQPEAGLLKQTVHIRTLARKAIAIVERTLVTTEAWPELHRAAEYRQEVLLQAAKSLSKEDKSYSAFRKVLKTDETYCRIIGKWVLDRLAHARCPVRPATLYHIAVFQLGLDNICRKRVEHLLTADTYVYPGEWEVDKKGMPVWVVQRKRIYMNKGLINVLQESFFNSPMALGFRYKAAYHSTHPERTEHEMCISLVALVATGLHAALDAWKNGDHHKCKSDKFDGDTYKSIYHRHVEYLESLKEKSHNVFHSIMSEIYSLVIGNTGIVADVPRPGNALAVLDLSGWD